MKKTVQFFIYFVLFVYVCGAQQNVLSADEFDNGIKFNGVSLSSIMATEGDLEQMRSLFGNDMQEEMNDSAPFLNKEIYNEGINISFQDDSDTGNQYYLSSIYVLNANVTVTVQGISVKIGDHRSKFDAFMFNSKTNEYVFIDDLTGSALLMFKIDKNDQISEIRFIAF